MSKGLAVMHNTPPKEWPKMKLVVRDKKNAVHTHREACTRHRFNTTAIVAALWYLNGKPLKQWVPILSANRREATQPMIPMCPTARSLPTPEHPHSAPLFFSCHLCPGETRSRPPPLPRDPLIIVWCLSCRRRWCACLRFRSLKSLTSFRGSFARKLLMVVPEPMWCAVQQHLLKPNHRGVARTRQKAGGGGGG